MMRIDRTSTMTITITAFDRSPDGGKGLARDTRVRWALEEAGLAYEVRRVSFAALKETAHLALHPFGQLDGGFSAGDLLMVSVLLRLRPSGLLDEFPRLAAYVARGEARPAYQRAFAAQLAINAAPSPER
jgi:glutathione S-transferase